MSVSATHQQTPGVPFVGRLVQGAKALRHRIAERRKLRALAGLSDRHLKDVGIRRDALPKVRGWRASEDVANQLGLSSLRSRHF